MLNALLQRDLVPDPLLRAGIRRLLRQRLTEETRATAEAQQNTILALLEKLRQSPIAVHTQEANEQHYEVPTAFFQTVLGKRLKYSSGYWQPGDSLDDSEERMLALTCERAELADGQTILELGCGWGSLTLFMAERFPGSKIVAVSNSRSQKDYIDDQLRQRGMKHVTVMTADMNVFQAPGRFQRVVSVEMFEHMRNYELLLQRIASWMEPDGKLFVHIFTHRELAYLFEVKDDTDWMAKYFFRGGIMPSDHLLFYFSQDLRIETHWRVDGTHYQKTSEAWLSNMDAHREQLWPILETTYGAANADLWWSYWRIFFMSCAELWGYRGGTEWMVSHYRLVKR